MVLREARANEYERLQQTVHMPDGDKPNSKPTAPEIKKNGDSRMDAANLRRAQDWARAEGQEPLQQRPRHQTEGSIGERVREPNTDDATPTTKVVEHQRKENGGVGKEPDAAKCPPNAEHVTQPHGGTNNKADRYATLRLGQKGRARDR